MPPELIARIEAALQKLESWKGRWVIIDESLSRLRNQAFSHDRHFATKSRFAMRLEWAGWAISGGNIDLSGGSGEHQSFYQLTTDRVVAVEDGDPDAIVFVEHFELETERRSAIRLLH